jgi:hypothetical protein
MSLQEWFDKLFNEQQWREQQAMKMQHHSLISDGQAVPLKQLMEMSPQYEDYAAYAGRQDMRGSQAYPWTTEEMMRKKTSKIKTL